MIVLGIDPGGTIGWAVVGHLTHVVACGSVKHVDRAWLDTTAERYRVHNLCIEKPVARVQNLASLGSLIDVALQAGTIAGWWTARGRECVLVTSWEWRRWLTSQPSAPSAIIKAAVYGQATGVPVRTNDHVRDAIGVAMYGAWRAQQRGDT